ncbi:DUF1640 domain-containing protein [Methylobacterium sp. PvR107]|uniref:DUF1640 domain-containing protein n=1 Tax=Methylobacterium sp. PvR107 TaxID=2806597 RepID=UPI001AE2E687|nr:DUF1640 domain-containing protein [Methylobacterium sp. PvR107]MBP1178960.1 hypothetical protein [Methylobacterium sp. PvR107]
MTYAFDTLKFTPRLEQVGVGREQAVAHAELSWDMTLADTATKAELAELKKDLESSLRELEPRMTGKIGAIVGAPVAVIVALQKFL